MRSIPDIMCLSGLKGAVMYQIYVDRFCNGDPSNDVETGEYFYIGDTSVKVDRLGKGSGCDGCPGILWRRSSGSYG